MNQGRRKKKILAIKLDIHKAYVTISWDFLPQCLSQVGPDERIVGRIMRCVSTASFRIRVNGNLTVTTWPSRGLRRGDPISPYLYIICGDAPNRYLKAMDQRTKYIYPKIAPRGDRVGLQFIDDLLIFLNVKEKAIKGISRALTMSEEKAGQAINRSKLALILSKGTQGSDIARIKSILGIGTVTESISYLGASLSYESGHKEDIKTITN